MSEDFINQDLETLMKEGKEAFENDDLEKADRLLHQALGLDLENADLHVDLGNLFLKLKKTFKAREHYQRASELKSDSPRPWHGLGRVEEELGNTRNAIEYFEKAINLDPDFYVSLNSLGNCYLDLGQLAESEKYYHQAICVKPKEFMAIYGLALNYSKSGKCQQAVEILTPFLNFFITDRKLLLYFLSQEKLKLGHYEEALNLCSLIIEEFDDRDTQFDALAIKAVAWEKSKDFKKASDCYKKLVKMRPSDSGLWIEYFWMLALSSEQKKVVKSFKIALSKHPEDALLYFHIAAIYNYFNDLDNALKHITESLKFDPLFVEAKVALACLYFKFNEIDKALIVSIEANENVFSFTDQRLSIHLKDLAKYLKLIGEKELSQKFANRYLEINLET